jgi:Bifunctional DNA primase/polymerase, N-terminal
LPPLPAAGKAIYLEGWQTANITPEAIVSWERGRYQSYRNTGVRTKYTPAFDIDIKEQAAAEAVEAMVRDRFGGRGKVLLRIGMAPKRALLFRTESPFNKISRSLIAADGSAGQKFEFLGDGQQIVADGIHPDTKRPYTWYGGTPWEVPASALPLITEAEARALVYDAAALLVERFGYRHANQSRAGESKGALDWGTLESNICDGVELHDSLRDLAWRLVLAGTPRDVAMRYLRTLMNASATPRDDRWQDRYDSIPRLVDSAMKKAARPDAASEFEPVGLVDDAPSDGASNSKPEPRLPFIIAAAWHGLPIPEREWVLRDRIPMHNVTLLAGDGGVGNYPASTGGHRDRPGAAVARHPHRTRPCCSRVL